MCRAVWVAILGSTPDACKALRRACGADAQVVAMAVSPGPDLEVPYDVLVIDAAAEGARAVAEASDRAVVWVGADAPAGVHAVDAVDPDAVQSAITKALIARRS